MDVGRYSIRGDDVAATVRVPVGEALTAPSSKPASRRTAVRIAPSLHVVKTAPSNLPIERLPLIGREAELAALQALLGRGDVGLVTLTGVGGSGKTRLAIQAASDLRARFPDGVWFVDLAPLRDAAHVADAMALAVGVRDAAGGTASEQLVAALRDAEALLVMDNFEHVIAAARHVGEVLASCRDVKVLATSREPLRLHDEHELPVGPLRVPEVGRATGQGVSAELVPVIGRYPAVALFVERARAARPDFVLGAENARAVAEVCRRLDGMPLAIELAASRVRVLPVEAILARLEHRLDLLTGGARDRPERQQTLRAATAWSYDLLAPAEQRLFRRLAAFVGGFPLEAAEAMFASGVPLGLEVLDGLDGLVARSMVRQAPAAGGEPRWALLETLREFGLECLEAEGELEAARRDHFRCCLDLGLRAAPALTGPDQATWLDRIEADFPNIRAAVGWGMRGGADAAEVLRLLVSLRSYWHVRTDGYEAMAWLSAAVDLPGAPSAQRAEALNAAGNLALGLGDYERASSLFEEGLSLFRSVGDALWEGRVLGNMGIVSAKQGHYQEARTWFQASLDTLEDLGDVRGTANAMLNLSVVCGFQGEGERAERLGQEALALYRRIGDVGMTAATLENIAGWMARRGEADEAWRLHDEALQMKRQLGDRASVANSLGKLATLAHARGEHGEAVRLADESMRLMREVHGIIGLADTLLLFALLAAAPLTRLIWVGGRLEPRPGSPAPAHPSVARLTLAARWMAASDAIREATRNALEPEDREVDEANHAALRAALGKAAYEAACRHGRSLAVEAACDEAHAFALRVAAGQEAFEPGSAPAGGEGPVGRPVDLGGLTRREAEVAGLIAAGLTYREIAATLSVTVKTVEKHVGGALGKLGLDNRTQLALWAQAHRLATHDG